MFAMRRQQMGDMHAAMEQFMHPTNTVCIPSRVCTLVQQAGRWCHKAKIKTLVSPHPRIYMKGPAKKQQQNECWT
jgi:hypothetical protein